MQLHVSDAWLRRLDSADLDAETEAGRPVDAIGHLLPNDGAGDDPGRPEHVFALFVRQFRRSQGLTIPEMSARVHVEEAELRRIERNPRHRADANAIRHIAEAIGVNQNVLVRLRGLEQGNDQFFQKAAFAFIDRSEEAAELTSEEQKAFDNYVSYLKGRSIDLVSS